jgi:hypothetical protein
MKRFKLFTLDCAKLLSERENLLNCEISSLEIFAKLPHISDQIKFGADTLDFIKPKGIHNPKTSSFLRRISLTLHYYFPNYILIFTG